MKVVFLDIDGVLNDFTTDVYGDDTPTDSHLKILKHIIDETGAEIVLSSTWRLFVKARKTVEKRLADFGMKLFGVTMELRNRPDEIREWLSRHNVENFVILDDEPMSNDLKSKAVKTTLTYGLLPSHAERAIKILNAE